MQVEGEEKVVEEANPLIRHKHDDDNNNVDNIPTNDGIGVVAAAAAAAAAPEIESNNDDGGDGIVDGDGVGDSADIVASVIQATEESPGSISSTAVVVNGQPDPASNHKNNNNNDDVDDDDDEGLPPWGEANREENNIDDILTGTIEYSSSTSTTSNPANNKNNNNNNNENLLMDSSTDEEEDDINYNNNNKDQCYVTVPIENKNSTNPYDYYGMEKMEGRKRLFSSKSILSGSKENRNKRKRLAYKSVKPSNIGGGTSDKKNKSTGTTSQQAYLEQRERQAKALLYSDIPPTFDPSKEYASMKKKSTTNKNNKASTNNDNNNKETASSTEKRIPALEIWRGKPTETLVGLPITEFPDGWEKATFRRQSGSSKGTTDSYWYSPGGKKFRSLTEVRKFFIALAKPEIGNDEAEAWKIFKTIQL